MRKRSFSRCALLLYFSAWIYSFAFTCDIYSGESQGGQTLRIGFWNIRDLSVASRDSSELAQIAAVIHNFDCLAICELNDGSVLDKLKTKLKAQGGTWGRVQTIDKVGNTPSTAERYGFLYRTDKLRIMGTPKIMPELNYLAPGETQFRRFDREPLVSSFKTLDGRFDFTVIVVHITWGSKAAYRIGEIQTLTNYYTLAQLASGLDDDVILCGDFNRNVGDTASLGVLTAALPGFTDTTSPNVPTKIDTDNTYDHLLFQTNFMREYTGVHGVIKFDEDMFGNDDEMANEVCSDHRPVWAEFRVPNSDDD